MTIETIVHISGFLEDIGREMTIVDIDSSHHLVTELGQDIHIVTILEWLYLFTDTDIFTILCLVDGKSCDDILAIEELVTEALATILDLCIDERILSEKIVKNVLSLSNHSGVLRVFLDRSLIFFFAYFFIEDMVGFVLETRAEETVWTSCQRIRKVTTITELERKWQLLHSLRLHHS